MPFTPFPQSEIADEFALAPVEITNHLRPVYMGGHAKLIRFDEVDEQAEGLLGDYDPLASNDYPYPGAVADAIQDLDYVAVRIQNALLRYYLKDDEVAPAITVPSGFLNRITSASTSYKSNGASYPRDPIFLDRDVTVGDVVDVRGTVGMVEYSKRATVAGFVAEPVAAVTGSAAADAANQATVLATTSDSQIAGAENEVIIDSVDGSTYDGLADGDVTETYVIEVIQGSVGGDATTALFKITSASGNDDVASIAPAAFTSPSTIGTRGLTVTFDVTGSGLDTPLEDFIVGQKWSVLVRQAFTAPAATAAGTYTGTQDNVYIIEVITGGTYAGGNAQIRVTSTLGIDASGPTTITAAATPVAVGSKGVTVAFDATALCAGDKWTIPVTAASTGEILTLVLSENLPAALAGATDLEVALYIKQQPALITRKRVSTPGEFNWVAAADEITLSAGIEAYDATWTDSGVQQPLPVMEGEVYVDTRQWLQDNVGIVQTLTPTSENDIEAVLGTIHPDNPLAFGMACGLGNASGSLMVYTAVSDPSVLAEWDTPLEALAAVEDTYNIVPLTQDVDVYAAVKTHVEAQSAAESGGYRVAWFSIPLDEVIAIVDDTTTSDEAIATATVDDDPATSGTQYTRVTVASGNALLQTLGVRAGDVLRTNFTDDGWGDDVYDSFVIEEVINETQLLLVAPGLSGAVAVAQKFEIWRTNSKTERADSLKATIAADFQSTRLRNVWPDQIGGVGGHYLAAALAGAASGAPSQQGLRNVEIVMPTGYSDLSRYFALLSVDIATLPVGGVWVVGKTLSGTLYSKSAVTTYGGTDIITREEMVIRNGDGIALYVIDAIQGFVGRTNVTDDTVRNIAQIVREALVSLLNTNSNTLLGSIILAIVSEPVAARHSVLLDRITVSYTVRVPVPLGGVDITQTIVI